MTVVPIPGVVITWLFGFSNQKSSCPKVYIKQQAKYEVPLSVVYLRYIKKNF